MPTHMSEPNEYLSPKQAGPLFPGNYTPHRVILRMKEGKNGIRLRHIYDGRRYWTTAEWIQDFLDALTAKRGAAPESPTRWQKRCQTDLELLRLEFG